MSRSWRPIYPSATIRCGGSLSVGSPPEIRSSGLCHRQTEVAGDPQVQAQVLTEVPFPGGGCSMLVTGPPIGMSATPTAIDRFFPAVGEHNEEVHGELSSGPPGRLTPSEDYSALRDSSSIDHCGLVLFFVDYPSQANLCEVE